MTEKIVVQLRQSVIDFAELMELILQDNDYKDGWKEVSKNYLWKKLLIEIDELKEALIDYPYHGCNAKEVKKECADIANFAMMIADNIKYKKFRDE